MEKTASAALRKQNWGSFRKSGGDCTRAQSSQDLVLYREGEGPLHFLIKYPCGISPGNVGGRGTRRRRPRVGQESSEILVPFLVTGAASPEEQQGVCHRVGDKWLSAELKNGLLISWQRCPWPWVLQNRDRELILLLSGRVSLSPGLWGLLVTIQCSRIIFPGCFLAVRSQLSHISHPCVPHTSPAPAEHSKARFKQGAVLLNLAALFQPGGFWMLQVGKPMQLSKLCNFQGFPPFSGLHC